MLPPGFGENFPNGADPMVVGSFSASVTAALAESRLADWPEFPPELPLALAESFPDDPQAVRLRVRATPAARRAASRARRPRRLPGCVMRPLRRSLGPLLFRW